jgi:hypothetical protein
MPGRGEHAHLGADLGDQQLGGALLDAGDRGQQLNRRPDSTKRPLASTDRDRATTTPSARSGSGSFAREPSRPSSVLSETPPMPPIVRSTG